MIRHVPKSPDRRERHQETAPRAESCALGFSGVNATFSHRQKGASVKCEKRNFVKPARRRKNRTDSLSAAPAPSDRPYEPPRLRNADPVVGRGEDPHGPHGRIQEEPWAIRKGSLSVDDHGEATPAAARIFSTWSSWHTNIQRPARPLRSGIPVSHNRRVLSSIIIACPVFAVSRDSSVSRCTPLASMSVTASGSPRGGDTCRSTNAGSATIRVRM